MAKKTELKTKITAVKPEDFIKKSVKGDAQKECLILLKMMEKATGDKPKMWGSAIVGFGDVHLKYATGRELDWFKMGFSPRKANLTLYGLGVRDGKNPALKKLGKHKIGKGCLYIKSLDDVDVKVLEGMMKEAVKKK